MRSSPRRASAKKPVERDSEEGERRNVVPSGSIPRTPPELKEFMRQADLSKLLEDYTPSSISQEAPAARENSKTFRLRHMDIVCGRGTVINQLSGNILMRYAVFDNQKVYLKLDRGTKSIAADAMIGLFEAWGSRFLEPVDPNDVSTKALFRLSPYARVHEKMMQTLRQKFFKKPTFGATLTAIQAAVAAMSPPTKSGKPKSTRSSPQVSITTTSETTLQPKIVTPRRRPKAKTETSISSMEESNETLGSPSTDAAATPIVLKGSFAQPVAAPVLSLTSFLRNQMEKRV